MTVARSAVVVALTLIASCTARTSEGPSQTSPSNSSTSESPTQERSAPSVGSTPVLKGYIHVGKSPQELAASGGVLWVTGQTDIKKQACRNGAGHHCNNGVVKYWVVEVDERSGSIVRRVLIKLNPPSEMAVGYGALWAPVWNFHTQQSELFEVPNARDGHPEVIPGL